MGGPTELTVELCVVNLADMLCFLFYLDENLTLKILSRWTMGGPTELTVELCVVNLADMLCFLFYLDGSLTLKIPIRWSMCGLPKLTIELCVVDSADMLCPLFYLDENLTLKILRRWTMVVELRLQFTCVWLIWLICYVVELCDVKNNKMATQINKAILLSDKSTNRQNVANCQKELILDSKRCPIISNRVRNSIRKMTKWHLKSTKRYC